MHFDHRLKSVFALAGLLIVGAVAQPSAAAAQTLETLHTFCTVSPCVDGLAPNGGLLMDSSGDLYGTTQLGGKYAKNDKPAGVVFELIAKAHKYAFKVLANFHGAKHAGGRGDGAQPNGNLIVDAAGNLYGTTFYGGSAGLGSVFELTPNARHSKWTLKVLYSFCTQDDCADGWGPTTGLTYVGAASGAPYDGVSPLYGFASGVKGKTTGNIFKLTPGGGAVQESVIYNFCAKTGCPDGSTYNLNQAPLTTDAGGNLFGVTYFGGANNAGTVFELAPGSSGQGTQTLLYSFCAQSECADGGYPTSPVILDASGNVFGTTQFGGIRFDSGASYGVAYKIARNGGNPQYSVLHDFCSERKCKDGGLPEGALAMDAAGRLFGTTGAFTSVDFRHETYGTIFKLDTGLKTLYTFCAQPDCADGESALGTIMDGSGKFFGTTRSGAEEEQGTVFEFTP